MSQKANPLEGLKDTDLATHEGSGWNRATVVSLATEDGVPILIVSMPDGSFNKFTFHGCKKVSVKRNVLGKRQTSGIHKKRNTTQKADSK